MTASALAVAVATPVLIAALAACAPQRAIVSADRSVEITHYEVPEGRARALADRMADERARVRAWWGTGFDGAVRVEISAGHNIAMALIPAWRGDHGRMLVPTRTADTSSTPTLHELVHIEAPNGNRFLAEGLAVYLQARLGGVSAYPNFGADLHEEARGLASQADLHALDATATPSRPGAETALGFRGAYIVGGSFVRFLVETYGKEKFQRLYGLTPFRPGTRLGYGPARYESVYGKSLADLAREWRAAIAK